jgi:2'-5' RNA ligase
MYVPREAAGEIEAVRAILDPVQRALIAAHVTLCREEELDEVAQATLHDRLANLRYEPITLRFGRPERFFDHGILLECIDGQDEFRMLRDDLLGSKTIRTQRPHITLAHPRNAKALGNSMVNASKMRDDISITFRTIQLIEQQSNQPWQLLSSFDFAR